MHAEERQRECSQRHSEVRAGTLSEPFQAQSVSHRTDWTSLESKRTPRDFPRRLFLYPVSSAAARTAPNGVKERASFCLVFRSLNTTSSHRMFSMGYRGPNPPKETLTFKKEFFWQTTSGSLPAGLNGSLFTDLQLQGKQVLAMITDGAAINRAAVRNLDPRKRLCRR